MFYLKTRRGALLFRTPLRRRSELFFAQDVKHGACCKEDGEAGDENVVETFATQTALDAVLYFIELVEFAGFR